MDTLEAFIDPDDRFRCNECGKIFSACKATMHSRISDQRVLNPVVAKGGYDHTLGIECTHCGFINYMDDRA